VGSVKGHSPVTRGNGEDAPEAAIRVIRTAVAAKSLGDQAIARVLRENARKLQKLQG
jgi:hypothetical protein